jgi:hypothetical protein
MVSTRRRAYVWGVLEIQGDFAQASALILFRIDRDGEFKPSPYQVADAGHSIPRAITLVNKWLKSQNPGRRSRR